MSDNTIRLTIDCQELPPEQMAEIFKLKGGLGWTVFSENEVSDKDIPKEEAPEIEQKSKSQRLRSVLFLYWDKCTNRKTEFQRFYDQWYEKKISEVKELLP